VVLDLDPRGCERIADDLAHTSVTAHANRSHPHARSSVARCPTSVN
jgi:hypothetical protein